MRAVVVLNGEPPTVSRLQELAAKGPVYVADGGATICLQAGIRPEWVAGDLDSSDMEAFPEDWEVHHHPEQTRTDFQKVMGDLPEEITEVLILGGLGGRMDHQLTNLLLASGEPETLGLTFEHGRVRLIRITPSRPFQRDLPVGTTLSLLPVSPASGVQSTGLRWNLNGVEMKAGVQLGQSNEVTGPLQITVDAGSLFAWFEQD